MVLHLAESKAAWAAWAARPSGFDGRAPPMAARPSSFDGRAPAGGRAPACFEVDHLGGLTPDPSLRHAGTVPAQRLRLKHHRPASTKASSLLLYANASSSHLLERHLATAAAASPPPPALPPLLVRTCDSATGPADATAADATSGKSLQQDQSSNSNI